MPKDTQDELKEAMVSALKEMRAKKAHLAGLDVSEWSDEDIDRYASLALSIKKKRKEVERAESANGKPVQIRKYGRG